MNQETRSMPSPVTNLRPYFTALDEVEGMLEWSEVFGNQNPVELDIGCGRGKFLFDSSVSRADTNWLGVELDYSEGRRGAKRLAKRQLPNARIIGGDAIKFLSSHVMPGSIDAAHVYFPDPWWKRKHAKRRLFTDTFADLLAQVVKPGGYVHSWSDVGDYFEVISALMNHHVEFISLEPNPEPEGRHHDDFLTGFHRRGRLMGATIHRGRWRRR